MADPFESARLIADVLRELPENVRDEVVALAMAHVATPATAELAEAIRKDVVSTDHGLHSGDEYP